MEWKPAGDVRFRPLAKVRLLVLLSFFAGLSQTLLAATPGVEGQWGPPIYFTTVPISAAVLPNGKLLIFSSWDRYAFQSGTGARDKTYSNLYDPATDQVTEFLVTQTNHDMFCPGTALLEDGRLLVNGGGPHVTTTSIYDFSGNQWVRGASMSRRRWYNASTTLPGGGVFTLGGIPDDGVGELWTSGAGWSVLAGAPVTPMTVDAGSYMPRSEQHPKVLVAPNGKLFAAGPTPNMQWYDTASGGSVRFAGRRGDDIYAQNNVTVMFDVGKILTAGGSPDYDSAGSHPPASANAYVIDINSAVSTRKIAPMQYRRSYANGVILPDGRILVVGGKGDGKAFSDAAAVFVPEMFDPDTETWTPMARQATPRTYHSTALLLPDGRVFSGGGGLCGNCSVNHADGEIYSPPYLFQGPPPVIQGAPTVVGYNASFSVATTGDVARLTLVRMSSTTHTVNTDQRFLELESTPAGGGSFTVTSPLNANIAPPGYYMLFALSATGVPSVSKIMKLSALEVPVTQHADLSITKADSPDPVFETQQLSYTVTVRNNGPDGATGVTVTDPLPGGVFFVSAAASQGGCSGTATVTCFLGNLANGASATVTIIVIPAAPGALSITASVTGSPSDPDPTNNAASSTTTVLPIPDTRADLALTQTDAFDPGAVAEPLAYTLTVTNHGPSTATGVQITDNLPPGIVLAGPPIPGQGICAGTGPVICDLGTLAANATATVTLNVLPIQSGTVSNAASVVGDQPDLISGNNSESNTTTLNQVAVLPSPQGSCNRSICVVRLTCTLGAPCAGRPVTLFVRGRNVRRNEGASQKAPKRIRFASGIANIPPGGTATVRLRQTDRGKTVISDSNNNKRLRGVMEIRNPARTLITRTPIMIRLR